MLVAVAVVVVAGIITSILVKSRRRSRLFKEGLQQYQQKFLKEHVALYSLVPQELKPELHGWINLFINEKDFEGCGGLEVTDNVKLTIGCLAGILLLNKKFECYPRLNTILIYPSAYVAKGAFRMGNQVIFDEESARLGESWQQGGTLILAWDKVQADAGICGSGQNVVVHEFAHRFDQANGIADGIPIMKDKAHYERWCKIMHQEYEGLREELRHGYRDIIDPYGATNPAEFFAVSTEAFFCAPGLMKKFHPELYQELQDFYQLDPDAWYQNNHHAGMT